MRSSTQVLRGTDRQGCDAFRDEYINRILTNDVSKDAPILVINPLDRLSSIPFDKKHYVHLKAGFEEQTVREALELLKGQVK